MESGYNYLTPAQKQAYSKAKTQLATASDPEERKRIIREACMSPEELEAQEYIDQLSQLRGYTQNDWLFLTGDAIADDISLESRFAVLDHLKKNEDISAEDLINFGIFTEETRYVLAFFGLFREDVASEMAALLELSYRVTRQGTTVYELSLEEQQQRNAQMQMLLGYLAFQVSQVSVQQYNAAGGAIRYPGATTAAPGYESVPSDFGSFNLPANNWATGNPVPIAGFGNTGRTIPNNLNEQIAMQQVQSNPLNGATKLPIKMGDERWPAEDGWVKMQNIVTLSSGDKVNIHFTYNPLSGLYDDFKFK